ncbi:MAG: hypothetical protein ACTSUE_25860 [Promethearchaeota archaeon]
MKKVLASFAGIISLVSILPFNFMAWWTRHSEFAGTNEYYHLTAFGFRINPDGEYSTFNYMFLIPAICVICGLLLVFAGVKKENGALSAIGGFLNIIGPVLFLLILNMNADEVISQMGMSLIPDVNIFFGSYTLVVSTNWYLNIGMFLPIGAGVIAIAASN